MYNNSEYHYHMSRYYSDKALSIHKKMIQCGISPIFRIKLLSLKQKYEDMSSYHEQMFIMSGHDNNITYEKDLVRNIIRKNKITSKYENKL